MLDTTLLILLGLAALGFISHNTTVAMILTLHLRTAFVS